MTIHKSGKEVTYFLNGSIREIYPDGNSIVLYANGDLKQVLSNGTIIYWFSELDITEIDQTNQTKVVNIHNKKLEIWLPKQDMFELIPNEKTKLFDSEVVNFLFNDNGKLSYQDNISFGSGKGL